MKKIFDFWVYCHPNLKKLIMKIKIAFLIIVVSVSNIFAMHSYSQTTKVSLDLKDKKLEEVLDEIEKQSEFYFIFNQKQIDVFRIVDIKVEDKLISDILTELFKGTDVKYVILDKKILLTTDPISEDLKLIGENADQQQQNVSGTITDAQTGEPLPGVNVRVKNTVTGALTDANGNYKVMVTDYQNAVLVFSFIGYETQEVPIAGQVIINVALNTSVAGLDEVIVIGYGTQKKKDLTGAIAHISKDQLEDKISTNVQDFLLADIPGLNASFNATPEGGGDLLIRGKASLNAGTYPLLVVDGVIYHGDLIDINPADIEAIDVLKDASSAAVYGAKAASGVILITTKKGTSSKPIITFNTDIGLATMEVNQRPRDPEEFLTFRQAAMEALDVQRQPYEYSDPRKLPSNISLDTWLGYTGATGDPVPIWLQRLNFQNIQIANYLAGNTIDWYDEVFHNGLRQDYTLSLSGKKEDISYYMSLEYLNNEGMVIGDKFSTIRGRLNLEGKATKFLTAGMYLQFADRDQGDVPAVWEGIIGNSPYGSKYNDDGSLRWSPDSDEGTLLTYRAKNPFNDIEYTDRFQKTRTITPNIFLKGDLPLGLSYQINFTPSYTFYSNFQSVSSRLYDAAAIGGTADRIDEQTLTWQIDNIIRWNRTFNDNHTFDVTLLANAEKFRSWYHSMYNEGFQPNDNLGYHTIGSGINAKIYSNDEYSTGDALMARLNYDFKKRYFITFSLRRDGYSAFGQQNPRATFPALALGWAFSEENFLKSWEWLDYGKLRLSYGINGNRDIGRYQAISDLKTGKYLNELPNGDIYQVSTLVTNRMSNPGLRWEQSASYNLGLDFTILNSRIVGTIDAYVKATTDLLVLRSLPDITGFKNVMDNLGEVRNKGIELSLNIKNIEHENFRWNSMFNFSLNRNKIVHLYGLINELDGNGNITGQIEPDDPNNGWFIGKDIDVIWDLKILGVWQENEAEKASDYGFSPGDFKLEDVNNDGLFTDEDRQFLGHYTPRFRWSLRNEFTIYKNLNLSFMIYSNWGQMDTFNAAKNSQDYPDKSNGYARFPYWTPENALNDFASLFSSDGGASYQVYRKSSFIRLHDVNLGYNFPKALTQKFHIDNLRINFNITNVGFYAPEWINWDPENDGPTPRYFTLGLNMTL